MPVFKWHNETAKNMTYRFWHGYDFYRWMGPSAHSAHTQFYDIGAFSKRAVYTWPYCVLGDLLGRQQTNSRLKK